MLDLLEKRVGIPEGATIVVDRGMSYPENVAELKRRKLHYLVAARQKERDRLLGQFESNEGFEEVIRRPRRAIRIRRSQRCGSRSIRILMKH